MHVATLYLMTNLLSQPIRLIEIYTWQNKHTPHHYFEHQISALPAHLRNTYLIKHCAHHRRVPASTHQAHSRYGQNPLRDLETKCTYTSPW